MRAFRFSTVSAKLKKSSNDKDNSDIHFDNFSRKLHEDTKTTTTGVKITILQFW
jgi:hypothetical protein